MTNPINPALARIAHEHLLLDTLEVSNPDDLSIQDLGIASARAALDAAYNVGVKVGIAREMGVVEVYHSDEFGRFPWRVRFQDGRTVMASSNFAECSFSRTPRVLDRTHSHQIDVESVPVELLHAVRTERERGRDGR